MVSSISGFDAISYLKGLNKVSAVTPPAAPTTVPAKPTTTTPSTTATSTNPLLGLSSNILTLLQGKSDSSSNYKQYNSLYGNDSSSDPLTGVYVNLYYKASQAVEIQDALKNAAQPKTAPVSVDSVISNYHKTLNASNSNLIDHAKSVLTANYGPSVST